MSDSGTRLESLYDLAKHIPVPIEPEVFMKIWTFTHGIATINPSFVGMINWDC